MEYLWLYFVLGAAFLRGATSVFFKVSAMERLNSNIILLVSNFVATIFLLFFIDIKELFNGKVIGLGIVTGSLFFLNSIFLVKALGNVSSSMIFINSRVTTTILLFVSGVIFFGESLTWLEATGIVVGFLVFFLLVDKKEKVSSEANFKKGMFYLFLVISSATFINIIHKFNDVSLKYNYLFFAFLSAFLIFFTYNILKGNVKKSDLKDKKVLTWGMTLGIIFPAINFLYLEAINLNSLAVVYKIFSFEIFVPIIFSIIYYKEKVTWRKILAFALTILSLSLFL